MRSPSPAPASAPFSKPQAAVLGEMADEKLAEREATEAHRLKREAEIKAAKERRASLLQAAQRAEESRLAAIGRAEAAMAELVNALKESEKYRAAVVKNTALAGVAVNSISRPATEMRLSAYVGEQLSKLSGTPARFGKIELRGTGRRHGDWRQAESEHIRFVD